MGKNEEWKSFEDTSAIVHNMDLIVSIDTSLIHLAGSMHKKSYLLWSKPADWRWTEDNNSTPEWYKYKNYKTIKKWLVELSAKKFTK